MSFCKFANEFITEKYTTIDNAFINEFMPNAPSDAVKVYLYGLYKCNNGADNSIEDFSVTLNLTCDDIISSFLYWQELGLVQVLNTTPIEVRYLPTKNASYTKKLYNKDKYKQFNITAQEIISGRLITPNEYNEYYNIIESLNVEQDALIMLIKYSVNLKGNAVNYNYIITVAKNFAYQGIKTVKAVEERLKEQEKNSSDVKLVLNALKIKRNANEIEYEKFLLWTKEYDFKVEVLVHLAKSVKAGGFSALENKVNKCYELKLNSIKEIEEYFENEKELFEIAKVVCKNIGVRYENLSIVVDTYIANWLGLGYTKETCEVLANYCFIKGIRSLEGLNELINKFYKLGFIELKSINNYIYELKLIDDKIKDILTKVGLDRNVINQDRNFYNTWVNDWSISEELIDYAISLSADKYQPMQFLNKVLAKFHTQNINTVEEAKNVEINFGTTIKQNKAKVDKQAKKSNYSNDELNSLFSVLKEVEL